MTSTHDLPLPALRALLDASSDATFTLDPQGHFTYVNARTAAMVNLTPAELLGRNLERDFGHAFSERWPSEKARALRTGCPVEYDAFNPSVGGWVRVRVVPTQDGLAVQIHDVTAARRKESLQQVTGALSEVRTPPQVVRVLLEQAAQAAGAYMAALILVSEDGEHLELLDEVGYPPELRARFARFPLTLGIPPCDAARQRQAVFVGGEEFDLRYPQSLDVRAQRTRSLASLPLIVGGELWGVLALSFEQARHFDDAEQLFVSSLVQQCTQALEHARTLEREAALRERERLLTRASELLSSSLEPRSVLESVARLAVPDVADWCNLFLPDEQGELQPTIIAHQDPERVAYAREYFRRFPLEPGGPAGSALTFRTQEAQLIPEVDVARFRGVLPDEQIEMIERTGVRSVIIVPLVAQGRALGVLELVSTSDRRRYGNSDLDFAQDFARRAAAALDNAQLHERGQKELHERQQLEAELRERETRLRMLVEHAAVGVSRVSPQGQWLELNPAIEQLLGYSREELLGMTFLDVTHPLDRGEEGTRPFRRLVAGEIGTFSLEKRYLHKAGHTVWGNLSVSAVRDEQGHLSDVVAVIRNITERKLAERERARFERLVEESADYIAIGDLQGQGVYVNPAGRALIGFRDLAEVRGTHILECFFPEDRAFIEQEVLPTVFREGSWQGDFRFRHVVTGEAVEIEFNLFVITDPETGEVQNIASVSRDIRERKRAERQLRESEERFRQLVAASPIGIAIGGLDGTLLFPNDAYLRLLGYSREQFETGEINWATLTPEHFREADEQAFAQALEQGTSEFYEKEMQRRDGSVVPVGLVLARYEEAEQPYVVGYLQDLTAQKEYEVALQAYGVELERRVDERTRELERSNAELERFAYVASHDLQEPLRTIASFTELIHRRYAERLDEQGLRYLALVTRGAERMKGLIDDLLVFSRLNAVREEPRPVSLQTVAHEALSRLQGSITQSGAQVTWGDLPDVQGVPSELVQLFQNLIGNAIKFRREGVTPTVSISAAPDGQNWHLRVADNGIGFEANYAERIFQIFQRLHLREQYEGSGMGLAIVRKIVERQGGRIWAESQPGVGSVFHFTLPAAPEAS